MTDYRTISLPDDLFRPRGGSFDLHVRQVSSDSVLSRSVRAGGLIAQLWRCELELATADRVTWQRWKAFRATLQGQAVLFIVRFPIQTLPLGVGGGYAEDNPPLIITGTAITGTQILQGSTTATVLEAQRRYTESVLAQWPAAVAGQVVLRKGDIFGLGGNAYISTADITADDDAVSRISFRAPLWKGAKGGDIITTRKVTCRMQLSDPNSGLADYKLPDLADINFAAQEVPFLS